MTRARLDWMDSLRGFAVLAVILMHARIITLQVTGIDLGLQHAVDRALVPVRMPLLVALSGALLARSLAKGRRRHYLGKLRGILWPYAVWMSLFLVFHLLRSAAVGEQLPWAAVGQAFYNPVGYLWFLGYLFAFHAVAGVLPAWLRTAAVPTAFALDHVVSTHDLAGQDLDRFLWLLPYFLFGDLVARLLAGRVPVAITRVANRLSWSPLTAVGRASIVYYAPHMLLLYGVIPLLASGFGIEAPVVLWVLGVASTVVAGWVLARVQHRPGWRWLFAWPTHARRSSGVGPDVDPSATVAAWDARAWTGWTPSAVAPSSPSSSSTPS